MLLAQSVPGIACDASGNFNVSNPGQLQNRAAIIQRGNCTFAEKVRLYLHACINGLVCRRLGRREMAH